MQPQQVTPLRHVEALTIGYLNDDMQENLAHNEDYMNDG